MRIALAISVVVHALLWVVAGLQMRGPSAAPMPPSMEVELVRPEEAPEAPKIEAAEAPKEADKPAEKPAERTAEAAPSQQQAAQEPAQPTPQQPQQAQQQAATESAPKDQQVAQAESAPTEAKPSETKPTDAKPSDTKPPIGMPQDAFADDAGQEPAEWSSWAESPLMNIPVGYQTTERKAKLTEREIAAFKAHVGACWQPPMSLVDAPPRLAVVLRVALKPNGALAGEPTLMAASASPKGAVLMQTAMQALARCQPIGVLPAGKYKEWKLLDLAFSPAGLTGLPKL